MLSKRSSKIYRLFFLVYLLNFQYESEDVLARLLEIKKRTIVELSTARPRVKCFDANIIMQLYLK